MVHARGGLNGCTSNLHLSLPSRRGAEAFWAAAKFWRDAMAGWPLASPFAIGFLIFTLVPMGLSVYHAFTTYNISTAPRRVYYEARLEGGG